MFLDTTYPLSLVFALRNDWCPHFILILIKEASKLVRRQVHFVIYICSVCLFQHSAENRKYCYTNSQDEEVGMFS